MSKKANQIQDQIGQLAQELERQTRLDALAEIQAKLESIAADRAKREHERRIKAYIQRTEFGVDIPTLMEMFNHSSQKQTLAYLGVQATEIKAAYMNAIR